MRRILPLLLAATMTVLAGCVKAKDNAPSATRQPSLGKKAIVLKGPSPDATSSSTTLVAGASGSATTASMKGGGASSPSSVASTAAWVTVVSISDPAGDQGADGPGYSDLRNVRVDGLGSQARATVQLGADVPVRLAAGEVMGIGVDFYRPGQSESDYQLFADGEADGWTAYLQTPQGFVAYPGAFTLSGNTLVFTVAWSAIGNPSAGDIGSFADWSKKSLVATTAAADKAPDAARSTFHHSR